MKIIVGDHNPFLYNYKDRVITAELSELGIDAHFDPIEPFTITNQKTGRSATFILDTVDYDGTHEDIYMVGTLCVSHQKSLMVDC